MFEFWSILVVRYWHAFIIHLKVNKVIVCLLNHFGYFISYLGLSQIQLLLWDVYLLDN